jgi:serine/threonine protein kinase
MPMLASANPLGECPGQELLLQFDLGMLPDGELARIEFHVSSCDQCVETLHKLQVTSSDDPVVACLKHYLQGPSPPVSPEYAEMEARARMLGGDDVVREVETWGRDLEDDIRRMVGRRIGPYEVLGKVGRGGMGIVYKAWQRGLERSVAIKMILAGHHASAPTVARFLREGKAVARLGHPNIVQVYDLGEHEGLPYLSMEFVDGGSLEANLSDDRPMEPRAAAALVATLAEAVEYAHNHGVVHRDLKPANVLVTREGIPQITDFGLAKLLDPRAAGEAPDVLTETDAILGTASYMAPEQAEGRPADISGATDIYALGAILYALLTGRPPFVGETKLKILERVRSAQPIPPSRLRPEVPFWLEAICLTCLEKAPSRRFSSAQALADDLGRWLRDERPQGTPGPLTRFGRTVRKNLVIVVCGGGFFSALAGFSLHDPDRAVARIQKDLAHGRAVSLIGKTGIPDWSRWRSGKAGSQLGLAPDRTCTISSWGHVLLELLPDPQFASYRVTAQVRHDKSDLMGEVGLYFAHKEYPRRPTNLQFFTQISFNAAIATEPVQFQQLPNGVTKPRPSLGNPVQLLPHLLTEEAEPPYVDRRLPGLLGARFKLSGQEEGRWSELEIIVTPARITAVWNGQRFVVNPSELQQGIQRNLTTFPPAPGELPAGCVPKFETRGGLGLYVWRGTASFREVTVSPLNPSRPAL